MSANFLRYLSTNARIKFFERAITPLAQHPREEKLEIKNSFIGSPWLDSPAFQGKISLTLRACCNLSIRAFLAKEVIHLRTKNLPPKTLILKLKHRFLNSARLLSIKNKTNSVFLTLACPLFLNNSKIQYP